MENSTATIQNSEEKTKFCKFCGAKIPESAVLCTACGRQVEEMHNASAQPNIVINNSNTNENINQNVNAIPYGVRLKNKWISFCLCLFLGFLGAHKFYEGKFGMGILYLFTAGLFGFGWIIDIFVLLTKPNPYAV